MWSPVAPAQQRSRSRPGEDSQLWPLPGPAGDFGLVDLARGERRVRAQDQAEQVGQPVGVKTRQRPPGSRRTPRQAAVAS